MPSSRKGSSGQIGGQGGFVIRGIWIFISCCIILALYRGLGGSPQSVWKATKEKSQQISDTLGSTKDPVEGFTKLFKGQWASPRPVEGDSKNGSGTNGGTPVKFDYNKLASDAKTLKIGQTPSIKYDRGQWKHWDEVRPCWTVREQVLYRDAVAGSTKLLDSKKKPVTDVNKACEIVGGKWIDRYTGDTITDPKQLDIDHMVPLRNAAISGGQAWPNTGKNGTPAIPNKELYANYLKNPVHLVAVSAKQNRAKGDKGPEAWMPPNKAYHKEYVASWVSVKKEFNLAMNAAEQKKVLTVLASK